MTNPGASETISSVADQSLVTMLKDPDYPVHQPTVGTLEEPNVADSWDAVGLFDPDSPSATKCRFHAGTGDLNEPRHLVRKFDIHDAENTVFGVFPNRHPLEAPSDPLPSPTSSIEHRHRRPCPGLSPMSSSLNL